MVLHRSRTPGPYGHPRSIRGMGVLLQNYKYQNNHRSQDKQNEQSNVYEASELYGELF